MNKTEFIDRILTNASFLSESDKEYAKQYLVQRLDDDTLPEDARAFAQNMAFSFDMFNFIRRMDNQRQARELGAFINEMPVNDKNTDCLPIEHDNPDKIPEIKKLFHIFKKKFSSGKFNDVFLCILLSLLFIPLCLIIGVLYAAPILALSSIWLFVMVLDAIFAIFGVISTSYGVANLFVSITVGLFEIGFGVVFFGIMLAVWVLNHIFITKSVPFLIKKITNLIKKLANRLISFILDKEAKPV